MSTNFVRVSCLPRMRLEPARVTERGPLAGAVSRQPLRHQKDNVSPSSDISPRLQTPRLRKIPVFRAPHFSPRVVVEKRR